MDAPMFAMRCNNGGSNVTIGAFSARYIITENSISILKSLQYFLNFTFGSIIGNSFSRASPTFHGGASILL